MANKTLDLENIPVSSCIRSFLILSIRFDRWVTAMSKAFWQNAELIPDGRNDFSRRLMSGSFLSFFTICNKTERSSLKIWISRLTSFVKESWICCNTIHFPLFGFPYRNTLLSMLSGTHCLFSFLLLAYCFLLSLFLFSVVLSPDV